MPPCSFCSRPESRALAGVPGRAARICDACVGICCEVLGARVLGQERPNTNEVVYRDEAFQQRLATVLASVGPESRMRDLTGTTEGAPPSLVLFDCSFCDAHRADASMMISGPRVFVCERCIAEAAHALSRVYEVDRSGHQ